MAEKHEGEEKNEPPTAKRKLDARKKGDVCKSRDVTQTVTLCAGLLAGSAAVPVAAQRIAALTLDAMDQMGRPFGTAAPSVGWMAMETLLWISGALCLPIALAGLAAEFLQVGPVFALEKIRPRLDAINPMSGLRKMFSINQLVEVLKALAKTCAVLGTGLSVIHSLVAQITLLPTATPALIGTALWQVTFRLAGWVLAAFVMISVLDTAWQRRVFMKKLRMSRRDIQREAKESEGDPHIKAQRRQTHLDWSQRNAVRAAEGANVLIVNPTHVAVAIDYDREQCPVPVLAAKGEDDVAWLMRQAAEAAGVPVLRNVPLARDMLVRAEVGELIPQEFFKPVAEVILWARQVREELKGQADLRHGPPGPEPGQPEAPRRRPPGEDLTRYPQDTPNRGPN